MEIQDTSITRGGLDVPLSEFKKYLNEACEVVLQRYENLDEANAYSGVSPTQVTTWFDETLPEEGMNYEALLPFIKEKVIDTATLNIGPYMYAYVMAGGTQISVIAELLAAAINQNVGKWHLAPIISELEKRVIRWGADFVGYPENAGGVLVSGGSAANLVGLTVGRNIFLETEGVRKTGLAGMRPLRVYGSNQIHNCNDKSIESLGIGSNNLIKIPVLEDFTIDTKALVQAIEEDLAAGFRPFCIIGNAGTVNTGAIDPLDELAAIAEKYELWYHIDGAYGGLAAAVPRKKNRFKGMDKAHSLAIDFHKWLYQPFEGGCALINTWENLQKSFYKKASYLSTDQNNDGRLDFNDYGFQLSRNAKALKIYMTFKAYGAQRLREAIEGDIDNTEYLANLVDKSSDFERCSDPVLGIVCFRYLGPTIGKNAADIDRLNQLIIPALEKDARVFITGTILQNRPVIRACLINHRQKRKHLAFLIEVIRSVGKGLVTRKE